MKLKTDMTVVKYNGRGAILNTPVMFSKAINNINPIISRHTNASRISAFFLYSRIICSEKFICIFPLIYHLYNLSISETLPYLELNDNTLLWMECKRETG